MASVKLNVASLTALGMARTDIEMIKFILERAINVEGADSANVPLAIVQRDINGDFAAGTITANLSGTASNAASLGGVVASDYALKTYVTGLGYATAAAVAATYAPLTGVGASGVWNIDITGNADTATDADSLGGVAAASYATQAYVNARTKADIGLGNVDNTSDANKPVSTATQAALDLKADLSNAARLVAQRAAASSHTGSTSDTTLATVTIPANTLGANGSLRITTLWSYTNSANNKTLRVKLGATSFLSTVVTTTASTHLATIIRNRNATNAQIAWVATSGASFASSASALTTGAIDTTAAQSLTFTAQLANAGETITLEAYTVEVLPAT